MSNRQTRAQQKLDIARDYRALFFDENGNLKPEGEVVLRDLERECGWMPKPMKVGDNGHIDPLRLAADTEKRRIYAHIRESLFGDLLHLKRATEADDG